MNRRQRKREERYLREIEAAEARARTPEAVALRARQAERKAQREAEREKLWARLEEEAWDERCFLEEALAAGVEACPDCGEHHISNAESEAIDRIVDDTSRTILAVHAVYRDGAGALIPFMGGAAQLSFAFEEEQSSLSGGATGGVRAASCCENQHSTCRTLSDKRLFSVRLDGTVGLLARLR